MHTTVIVENKGKRFRFSFEDCEIITHTIGDSLLVEISPFNEATEMKEEQQEG